MAQEVRNAFCSGNALQSWALSAVLFGKLAKRQKLCDKKLYLVSRFIQGGVTGDTTVLSGRSSVPSALSSGASSNDNQTILQGDDGWVPACNAHVAHNGCQGVGEGELPDGVQTVVQKARGQVQVVTTWNNTCLSGMHPRQVEQMEAQLDARYGHNLLCQACMHSGIREQMQAQGSCLSAQELRSGRLSKSRRAQFCACMIGLQQH